MRTLQLKLVWKDELWGGQERWKASDLLLAHPVSDVKADCSLFSRRLSWLHMLASALPACIPQTASRALLQLWPHKYYDDQNNETALFVGACRSPSLLELLLRALLGRTAAGETKLTADHVWGTVILLAGRA